MWADFCFCEDRNPATAKPLKPKEKLEPIYVAKLRKLVSPNSETLA